MKTKKIKINGLNLNCHFWGNSKNPKLFLFHGWMDMGASFEFICQKLQKYFYCIAPDFRGFGQSEHTKNKLGYFFFEHVADVHALINHFASEQEPLKILGHSMGGNITAFYAGAFPERVTHYINVEGFGIQDMPTDSGPEKMRKWLESFKQHQFKVYPKIKDIADRLRKTNPRLPVDRSLFLAKRLSKKVKGGFKIAADPRHKAPHPYLHQLKNVYPFWEKITAKCLLITAEKTEMASWVTYIDDIHSEISRRLDHFPKEAKRVLMKDCGHMVHHERPEELAAHVLQFLQA